MRFNRYQTAFTVLLSFIAAFQLSACSPDIKYPACAEDADCKTNAQGNAINEYCLNQQCQECRDNTHCGDGYECQTGRCEKVSECPCDAPMICQNDACVEPECLVDEDCAGNQTCEENSCVDASCQADADCGNGQACSNNRCVEMSSMITSECRSESGSGSIKLLKVAFDFNKADLTVETREALDQNAECMRQAPDQQIIVEGHCDERGTQEYNLALGERRASAVRSYLVNMGIPASQMRIVSKGKNQPVCYQNSESCFARNRRVEFVQD